MVISSTAVKKTAKTALAGRWISCMIAASVCLFAALVTYLAAGLLSEVFAWRGTFLLVRLIAVLFADIPLLIGVMSYFWRMLWDAEDRFSVCFRFFSDKKQYVRVLKTEFGVIFRCLLIGIVLFLPAVLIDVFSGNTVYALLGISRPEWLSNLWMVSRILKVFAGTVLALISLKFYMVPFLLVADEEMDPLEILHISQTVAKETAVEFIWLILSLLPWILLSVLVVPMIFTLPFIVTAYLVCCRFVTAQYNRMLKQKNPNPNVFTAN